MYQQKSFKEEENRQMFMERSIYYKIYDDDNFIEEGEKHFLFETTKSFI